MSIIKKIKSLFGQKDKPKEAEQQIFYLTYNFLLCEKEYYEQYGGYKTKAKDYMEALTKIKNNQLEN